MCGDHPINRTRYTRSAVRIQTHLRYHIPRRIQVHVGTGSSRRFFTEVEGVCLSIVSTIDHKTAATDISCFGHGYRKGKLYRYCRVDSVTIFLEDSETS